MFEIIERQLTICSYIYRIVKLNYHHGKHLIMLYFNIIPFQLNYFDVYNKWNKLERIKLSIE